MIQKLSENRWVTKNSEHDSWDQLWTDSEDAIPFAKAACLETFKRGFGIEQLVKLFSRRRKNNKPVIGLSLVRSRRWKIFREFRSPNNSWIQAGALLVDKSKVSTGSFRDLATQIKALPCSFVTLDWTNATIEVHRLVDAARLAGCYVLRTPQFETGLVRIKEDETWDTYFANRSKGFRKKIRTGIRKLEARGQVGFERHNVFSNDDEVSELLESAFAIEDLGWKGMEATSMNANLQAKETYVQVLKKLGQQGMLEIQFLIVGGKRIAFEIGLIANRTYYSHKIGFDPEYSASSPGQLLMYFQMQLWFANRQVSVVDTVGELNQASAKWCNDSIIRYRYEIATGMASRQLLKLCEWMKPMAKRILNRSS